MCSVHTPLNTWGAELEGRSCESEASLVGLHKCQDSQGYTETVQRGGRDLGFFFLILITVEMKF